MWNPLAWWRQRHAARYTAAQWRARIDALPILDYLSEAELEPLVALAETVLREKRLEGVDGLTVGDEVAQTTALLIALPLLNLGREGLAGWREVILYPAPFVVDHEEQDAVGVVHRIHEARSGESWLRGPLVLAWSDVAVSGGLDGYNVVIHEMAHKLDGLDGSLNGQPPLHRAMDPAAWAADWSAAYAELARQEAAHEEMLIDPYALESPAECFAVFSEYFFELPQALRDAFPEVYHHLVNFYVQDPAQRWDQLDRQIT